MRDEFFARIGPLKLWGSNKENAEISQSLASNSEETSVSVEGLNQLIARQSVATSQSSSSVTEILARKCDDAMREMTSSLDDMHGCPEKRSQVVGYPPAPIMKSK